MKTPLGGQNPTWQHTHFSPAVSRPHVWPLTLHGYFFFLHWRIYSSNNKEQKEMQVQGNIPESLWGVGNGEFIQSVMWAWWGQGQQILGHWPRPAAAPSCPAWKMNMAFTSLNKEHFSVLHDTWKVHAIQIILFINTFYVLNIGKLLLLGLAQVVLCYGRSGWVDAI